MQQLVRYSYVMLAFVILVIGLGYTLYVQDVALGGVAIMVVLGILLVFFVLARRGVPTPSNLEKRIRRARGSGRPVVVCFYGDLHIGSLVRRLLTARVERDYRNGCDFIYVSMEHPEAGAVAGSLEAGIGQFVLFDSAGDLVRRTKLLNRQLLEGLFLRPER